MNEKRLPFAGELSPKVTEGFPEGVNLSDLALLGHLPYKGEANSEFRIPNSEFP